jgi:subtilisin family serine protease
MSMAGMRVLGVFVVLSLMGCASQAERQSRALQAAPWLGASSDESYIVVTVRSMPIAALRAGSTARDYDAAQTYGPSPRARSDANKLATRYALRVVNAWPIEALSVHCVVYATPATTNKDELIARIRTDRLVESVQPLNSFDTLATEDRGQSPRQYSDPYYNLQTNLQVLQVPQAQRVSRGEGVRIAIVDTGVYARHPDLAGRVSVQRNFVGGLNGATAERHGTAVAGVIAALDNNKQGIVGIAPAAQLLSLRACWPAAANEARALCNTFTLAQALSAAIDLRADVVNLSLGGPADPLLNRLVAAGIKKGIVYIGAATPNATAPPETFPTNIPGVIAVDNLIVGGATRVSGPLFAPGTNVLTLTPSGGYDFMSGSSLAAASVSGGVALMLAHRRNTQRDTLYAALAKSVRADSVDLCVAIAALDPRASCAAE